MQTAAEGLAPSMSLTETWGHAALQRSKASLPNSNSREFFVLYKLLFDEQLHLEAFTETGIKGYKVQI